MSKTLNHIAQKFNLDLDQRSPIEIPRVDRAMMAEWLHELDFKVGVEVGVAQGRYSESIAKNNPQMKVYGVDPYVSYPEYTNYREQPMLDTAKEQAHKRLDKYSNYKFIEKTSMEAVKDFKDESIDFVYIDANHDFVSITNDLWEWSKKVRPGGIISGDDYFKHRGTSDCHVYQVINAYTDARYIKPWFVLGSSNIYDLPRDRPRSFLWIKG